jgi:NADPH:quinone reductase-like Zn-dependent oxidoreductase
MSTLPSSMKKIIFEAYGQPDNLKLVDSPLPTLEDDDVLVEVHGSSVNPVDWKLSMGYLQQIMPLQLPHSCGFDLAGVVVKVGPKVTSFKVGDEVYSDVGRRNSAMAQYAAVKESFCSLKPKNLSFIEAAALPLVALTSYQAIVTVGGIQPGKSQKVLILGGAGGTGYTAIQIAKHLGAHVTTTASTRNVEFVKKLGADRVIDYTKEKWQDEQGAQYDLLYDTIGEKGAWTNAHKVLKQGAPFVTIAGAKETNDATLDEKNKFVFWVKQSSGKDLEAIKGFVEKGAVTSIIDKEFDLAQTPDAFRHSIAGKAVGKIVIKIK